MHSHKEGGEKAGNFKLLSSHPKKMCIFWRRWLAAAAVCSTAAGPFMCATNGQKRNSNRYVLVYYVLCVATNDDKMYVDDYSLKAKNLVNDLQL